MLGGMSQRLWPLAKVSTLHDPAVERDQPLICRLAFVSHNGLQCEVDRPQLSEERDAGKEFKTGGYALYSVYVMNN